MIYLDYSANTPVDPAVLEAFCKAEQTYIGNPNSTHCAGRAACEEMARVTDHIAGLLGVEPAGIIYTSGASESNNLAIKGIAQASRSTGRHMISTVLEHASVGGTLTALQQQGWEVDLLDIQRDGTIDLEQLGDLLRKDTILVSVCAVDSVRSTVLSRGVGSSMRRLVRYLTSLDYGDSKRFSKLPSSCGCHPGDRKNGAGDGWCGHHEHRSSQVLRSQRQRTSPEKEQCDYRASDSRRFQHNALP